MYRKPSSVFTYSYVCDPQPIGRLGAEVSTDEVRGGHGTPIPASGSLPSTAKQAALQSCLAHQSGNSLASAAHTYGPELSVNSRRTVSLSAALMDLADLGSESSVFLASFGRRPVLPAVVTAS